MISFKKAVSATLASASLTAIAFTGGSQSPGVYAETPPVPPSTSDLVDSFEQHEQFRGISNEALPATANQGLQLGVVTVKPSTESAAVGRDGYVDYGRIEGGSRLIASSDGPGMDRFGVVIYAGGSERYAFDAEVPVGSTIEHSQAGTIEVETPDGRSTTLAPAVAVDISGNRFPTSYTLDDNNIVVEVDLDGADFPVLVDPVSANRWWGHEDWYSISDVRWQADWWNVGWIVKKACGNWACKVTAGRYLNWVYNTWQHAKNTGQCLHMKQLWTGQIIGINAYRCNWR